MTDDTTPRERRAKRTRKAILDTAMQLIVEKGPDKLSLREVARRIDYSPAGLYEYFGSKDELVEAACSEADRRLGIYLNGVDPALPPGDYLVELGLAYVRFARENPEHFLFLFGNREANFEHMLPLEDDFQTDEDWGKHDPNFALLISAVQRAIDADVIQTRAGFDTLEIAYTVWALAHGMASLQARYMPHLRLNYAATDRHAMRIMIAGLGHTLPE
ncbi:MAG: TetR/AcrR family transcriptional regulator [Anaerolineae bacterium]|nr:TetR/AcrR family transcriptional regulator [Anaerolineae bacterium]